MRTNCFNNDIILVVFFSVRLNEKQLKINADVSLVCLVLAYHVSCNVVMSFRLHSALIHSFMWSSPFPEFNQIIILLCLGGNYGDTAARHWIPVILVFFFYISALWRQDPCCFNTCIDLGHSLCWGFTAAALPDRPHLKLRHLHSHRGLEEAGEQPPLVLLNTHTHAAQTHTSTVGFQWWDPSQMREREQLCCATFNTDAHKQK